MNTDATTRVGQKRPGGRAAAVRTGVLEATAQLLAEVGYDQLSIEEVAVRAGVHKTTVYRRWPTKAALVTDAAIEQSERAIPVPDTGALVTDLEVLARSVVANISTEEGRRRATSLIVAASGAEDLAAGLHDFWNHRIGLTATIVHRAIERGELPPGVNAELLIETVIGPLWFRLILTGEPITDGIANHVAAVVAAGAMATSSGSAP